MSTNKESGWYDAGEVNDADNRVQELVLEGKTRSEAKAIIVASGLDVHPVEGHVLPTYLYRSAESQVVKTTLRKALTAKRIKEREKKSPSEPLLGNILDIAEL